MNEKDFELKEQVKKYLQNLGYPPESIFFDYKSPSGFRIDIVSIVENKVILVAEVKSKLDVNVNSKEEIGYHPITRQIQKETNYTDAKHYLISDGKTFLWLQTGKSGRPEATLEIPYLNFNSQKLQNSEYIKEVLFNLVEYIRNYPITGNFSFDVSIIFYSKLIQEIKNNDYLPLNLRDIIDREHVTQNYSYKSSSEVIFSNAIKRVDNISLSENRIVVNEFIEQYLQSTTRELVTPRWLADFMVKLINLSSTAYLIDMFARDGVITSEAFFNGYTNITSYYTNQQQIYWIKIQQLLAVRFETEVKFEPGILRGEVNILRGNSADAILILPPFALKLDNVTDSVLGRGGARDGISLFLEAGFNSVREGGKIVAIVPDGFLFSSSYIKSREFLLSVATIEAIISLPVTVFKPYAAVKTSIIVFNKTRTFNKNVTFFASIENGNRDNKSNKRQLSEVQKVLQNFNSSKKGIEPSPSKLGFLQRNLNVENFHFSKYWLQLKDENIQVPPAGFLSIPLKQLVKEIKRGSSLITDSTNGDLPYIGPASIRELQIIEGKLSFTSQEKLPKGNIKRLEANEVVINIIGPYRGKAALVSPEFIGLPINRHIVALKPNLNIVIPGYLAIALNSKFVQEQFFDNTTGTVIPALKLASFDKIYLPIPSLEEQESIYLEYRRILNEINQYKVKASHLENEMLRKLSKIGKEGGIL